MIEFIWNTLTIVNLKHIFLFHCRLLSRWFEGKVFVKSTKVVGVLKENILNLEKEQSSYYNLAKEEEIWHVHLDGIWEFGSECLRQERGGDGPKQTDKH